jgi:hypothetical protein
MSDPLTAIALLKTAIDALKGAAGVANKAAVEEPIRTVEERGIETRSAVIELQEKALRNLKSELNLRRENDELKRIIAASDDWKEKERLYPLRKFNRHAPVVRKFDPEIAKGTALADQLDHALCPNCFAKRIVSYFLPATPGSSLLVCQICGFKTDSRPDSTWDQK